MATIDINDAYILNETGAQVDKVTGLFYKDESTTAAEKAFAQLNVGASLDLGITGATIGQMPVVASVDGSGAPTSWNAATPSSGGGGGGRNILDNWYFPSGAVVNQRGFSSQSSEGYTVDRWKITRNSIITATIGSTGLTISKSVSGYAFFEQKIGRALDLEADYTFSVMTADGSVYSATRKFVNGTSSETTITIDGMNIGFGLYGKDGTPRASLYFGTSATGSVTIKAMKLELGSASTLDKDVPPDYGEELAKCQRYFFSLSGSAWKIFGSGFSTSTTSADILVPTPVTMRAKPTISYTGSFTVRINGAEKTVSAFSVYEVQANGVYLTATSSSLTASQMCSLVSSGGTIDLSADL